MRKSVLASLVIGCSSAILIVGLTLRFQQGDLLDFGIFYASGKAWLSGAPTFYPNRNLNPPHLLPLFAVFALLPLVPAWILWQILNLAGLAGSLFVTSRVLHRSWPASAVAILVASSATFSQVFFGQISWLLLLPMTAAWLAWRQGNTKQSAILLGLVVSVKPFLVPAILLLGRTRPSLALTAGASAIAPLLAVAALAPDALIEWLGAMSEPWHLLRWPHQASFAGALMHRGVPLEFAMAIASVPLLANAWRWRRFDADTQWALIVTVCVTISPLGWAYYMVWAVPPLFALWPQLSPTLKRWLVIPLLVPVPVVAAIPTLHGLYALPALALTIATIAGRHLRIQTDPSARAITSA